MEIDQSRVLEALPAMAWISDPNGNVDFVNRRWSEYTGLSINDARGSGWQIAIEPKSLPMVLDRWSTILASGEAGEIEVRLRRVDGQYRWFAISFSPMRDDMGSIVNWYGINTDVDRRKGSEDTLLASERNLGLIINSIPVMAWSARPDGAPEFFNHHYLHYVGLSIGQSKDWEPAGPLSEYWDLTAAVHPDDVDRLTDGWDAILASAKPGEAEVRLRRYDGKYRWFLLRANPLFDDAGKVIRWYGTHTDIHAKKRAEDAL
jgi:PAS domain S-box-containing protein